MFQKIIHHQTVYDLSEWLFQLRDFSCYLPRSLLPRQTGESFQMYIWTWYKNPRCSPTIHLQVFALYFTILLYHEHIFTIIHFPLSVNVLPKKDNWKRSLMCNFGGPALRITHPYCLRLCIHR